MKLKVHLTPKIFFPKTIRLILWSNLAPIFFIWLNPRIFKTSFPGSFLYFEKVPEVEKGPWERGWNVYAPSKYVKVPPFWLATQFNGAWLEGKDIFLSPS